MLSSVRNIGRSITSYSPRHDHCPRGSHHVLRSLSFCSSRSRGSWDRSALCLSPPSAFYLPFTLACSYLRPKGSPCRPSPVNFTRSTLKARRQSAALKLSTGWQKCVSPQTCDQPCCPSDLHFHNTFMSCRCTFFWNLLSFHLSSFFQADVLLSWLELLCVYFNSQQEGCKSGWMFGSVGPAVNCRLMWLWGENNSNFGILRWLSGDTNCIIKYLRKCL